MITDPLVAEIVASVFWFFAISVGFAIIFFLFAMVAEAVEKVWPAVLGWVLGIAWAVFALIQFIIHVLAGIGFFVQSLQ